MIENENFYQFLLKAMFWENENYFCPENSYFKKTKILYLWNVNCCVAPTDQKKEKNE